MEDKTTPQQTLQKEEPSHSPDTRPPSFPTPAHVSPPFISKRIAIIILLVIATIFAFGLLSFFKTENSNLQTATPTPQPTLSTISTSDWKTYINPQYNLSIKYPQGWYVIDHTKSKYGLPDPNRLLFLLFGKGEMPNSNELALTHPWSDLNIRIYRKPHSEETLKKNQIAKSSELDDKNNLVEIDIAKYTPIRFMGLKANKIIHLAPDIENGNLGIDIYFNAIGYGWVIHYPAIDYEGNSDSIYDQILSTFKFTN